MKTILLAITILTALVMSNAGWTRNICENGKGIVEGFNCNVPDDATGPPIYFTEKVLAQVTWVSPVADAHGFYAFTTFFDNFQTDGRSRIRPALGDRVEITIRAVIYPGLLKRHR